MLWSVWENSGEFRIVFKRLGEFWSFSRVLELLEEVWSNWEIFSCVWESFRSVWESFRYVWESFR